MRSTSCTSTRRCPRWIPRSSSTGCSSTGSTSARSSWARTSASGTAPRAATRPSSPRGSGTTSGPSRRPSSATAASDGRRPASVPSSTQGDVAAAARALGRPYRLDGVVVHGDHRGRELGYPTANLAWSGDPTVPADGVYAGWLQVLGSGPGMPAAISVGTNPQFDGRERRVEAYVLDRDDLDLYGAEVGVSLRRAHPRTGAVRVCRRARRRVWPWTSRRPVGSWSAP